MPPRYRQLLESLRREFPQPVSDPVHDAYVAFSVLRALDRVDALKSQAPILGSAVEPDFAGVSSTLRIFPRPASISVPAIFRTMCFRNPLPRIR